ncbi:MAG: hypothetical protein GXP58_06395 [Deltaproteobacteria bacterium]|nr:hypothetical protein [Deltaproteobacteria bacterium]
MPFPALMVHDFNTGQEVAAWEARYVIGSKVIPDMIPNIIAFRGDGAAKTFAAGYGGAVLSFDQVLSSVSPMGMAMPVRILTATTPPAGAFSIGAVSMHMDMDEVIVGSKVQTPEEFIKGRMMGPKAMTTNGTMLMFSYGLTHRTSVRVKASYLDKTMDMYVMGGKRMTSTTHSGISDLEILVRHNLWRDKIFSRFFTFYGAITLPAGGFDTAFLATPNLQLGTGTVTISGGLLGSIRFADFWLHTQAGYTVRPENSDDYAFGNVAIVGAALHYTPFHNLLVGAEIDGIWTAKSEYQSEVIAKSGGFRNTVAGLLRWRFLTVFGGNFNLMLSVATPIYEDLNKYGMGGGWSWKGMVSYKRRLPLF